MMPIRVLVQKHPMTKSKLFGIEATRKVSEVPHELHFKEMANYLCETKSSRAQVTHCPRYRHWVYFL